MGALMLQGTGSDVGKSVLVAGLCRAFANRGLSVRPFKPQNMATNSAHVGGGEIGGAQALQARACRVEASADMNPVLLKPLAEQRSRLIVQGRAIGFMGRDFRARRRDLLPQVLESFARLSAQADIVVVEGAGSPAEINLRAGDIANMGFARAADVPVVLVGDIDRGGVIAAIVGTGAVLEAADAAMIRGFIVNKFRGDAALFADGYAEIARRSGWPGFGILPWLAAARSLPAEDSLAPPTARHSGPLRIACPLLPRIANFDCLDPLAAEPAIELQMVPPGQPLPRAASLIMLPDSVDPLADLAALRDNGWDIDILAHHRHRGRILALGGGFLLLGERIDAAPGLALLEFRTRLRDTPQHGTVSGTALGAEFTAVHTDFGALCGAALARPFATLADGTPAGASSADGLLFGAPLHGLLDGRDFRAALLAQFGAQSDGVVHAARVEQALDDLAAAIEAHLDVDGLLALAQ